MDEEKSVKELLIDLSDVLEEIASLDENKVYEAKLIDSNASKLIEESPLERAKSLAGAAIACYVSEIQEILGYE
ncbi:hypothetical protein ACODG4_03405 [Vagococcus fluvialis]|uniref:hypothetical protein n=1 Tax=Vagococcus fluvialis TaxID=2738 RepID=UPI003B596354